MRPTDRSSLADHVSILTPSMGGVEVSQSRDGLLGRCLRSSILRISCNGLRCHVYGCLEPRPLLPHGSHLR